MSALSKDALKQYAFPYYADTLLRERVGNVADPDWAADQIDPCAFYGTVGGVAQAGPVTVTITPLTINGETPAVPAPIVFTNTIETLPQTAEGLYNAAVAAFATDPALPLYFEGVSSFVYRTGGVVVYFIPKVDAPPFTVTMTGTGTMTLTLAPEDTFPICAVMSNMKPEVAEHRSQVAVSFTPLDGSGNVIPDDGGATVDVEVVRVVKRRRRGAHPNEDDQPSGVTSSTTSTSHILHRELRADLDGSKWTVRLGVIANAPTGLASLEIRYRYVQA